ncbi:20468_t:CDS:10 [Gigaspora margarita]|uniref:20468_t:CDS:1 n=1 Tax=Gigaspora margarita TaxID=4874 RepID=A0ABM8VY71_GIGMA|nr:20468_t:CDS:10 [Gigaspora margarita]
MRIGGDVQVFGRAKIVIIIGPLMQIKDGFYMERDADIFEAFSNSPPYWMTNRLNALLEVKTTIITSIPTTTINLLIYLTEVVKWYKEEQGLTFRTLEPFNEPTTGLWHELVQNSHNTLSIQTGSQEGCTYNYSTMVKVIDKGGAYLNNKGLSNTTSVSIVDEGLIEGEIATINAISGLNIIGDQALSYVSQYNTHAYFGFQRTTIFDMAKNDRDIGHQKTCPLSEEILNDMRNLKPVAWVYWQVIEHAPNGTYSNDYGLIGADFSNSTIPLDIRLSFYGFAQFTKFIRPGYQIISSDDDDTLAAQDASKETLVLVCTNKNNASDIWNINVSKFNINSFNVYRTSNDNEALKLLPNSWNITDGILTYESPANSITTRIFNVTQ